MAGVAYLVDTNILLRLFQPSSSDHQTIRRCIDLLWSQGSILHCTSQNLAEFWNVCTRPAERNGFGISVTETDRYATQIEAVFDLLPESKAIHQEWRKLIVREAVSGVQVHDARLVAVMRVHRIQRLLTLNFQDFRRYSDIVALTPAEILAENA